MPRNRAAKKILWREGCLQRPERKANSSPPGGSRGCASTGSGEPCHRGPALPEPAACLCSDFPLPPYALIHADGQIAEPPGPVSPVSKVRVPWVIG